MRKIKKRRIKHCPLTFVIMRQSIAYGGSHNEKILCSIKKDGEMLAALFCIVGRITVTPFPIRNDHSELGRFLFILFPCLFSVISFVCYLAAKQDRLDSQTVYGRFVDKSGRYAPPGKRSTSDMVFLSGDFGTESSSTSSCGGSSSSSTSSCDGGA